MRLTDGRDFGPDDRAESVSVAVINEALARRLFPGGGVNAQPVVVRGSTLDVVGVVADVRQFGPAGHPSPPSIRSD
jgi:hypothetical protein